jgi:sortase A
MGDHLDMGRTLRILSVALITAGVLILVDVGLTLAWKEPLSSIYGSIQQSRARDQLNQLESEFPSERDLRRIREIHGTPRQIAALAAVFAKKHADPGDAIGTIRIPRFDLDAVLVEGTDTSALERGPGHYPYTPFPGQPGTVGIAGHRTTYLAPFRHIDELEPGDEVHLEMPYANFAYTVQKHEIVDPTDVGITHRAGYPRLILTACNPLYSAAQRYAVFAKLTAESLRAG